MIFKLIFSLLMVSFICLSCAENKTKKFQEIASKGELVIGHIDCRDSINKKFNFNKFCTILSPDSINIGFQAMKDSLKNGPYELKDRNGKLLIKGRFINNKEIGLFGYYFPESNTKRVVEYFWKDYRPFINSFVEFDSEKNIIDSKSFYVQSKVISKTKGENKSFEYVIEIDPHIYFLNIPFRVEIGNISTEMYFIDNQNYFVTEIHEKDDKYKIGFSYEAIEGDNIVFGAITDLVNNKIVYFKVF